ncbi:ATP-binding cassette domain-containing protein [uncultured Fibrella sp.]|uniref:ATP-binding cassette domain-containing protein n=1 Tax=uncultured Fibrella sp. TaxID=1284596 RepID=UPI0035CC53F8
MSQSQRTDIILRADNINLSLGGNVILRDLSVEIRDVVRANATTGQVVGFLGPSGVGKTKFFEILAGLLTPTSGSVQLGNPLQPVRAGMVGVVQQNYPLFSHHTIQGNLMLAARKRYASAKEATDRMHDVMTRFGMVDKLSLYPAQLSGGQRQRVAIAQQLLCSDHFLLLDEPFSGLDILMIEEVAEMIQEIAHAHELNTIIIVSHDIVATASVADTLWLMGRDRDSNGSIIPGAHIKHTYDLAAMDLCWDKEILGKPAFQRLVSQIRDQFHQL